MGDGTPATTAQTPCLSEATMWSFVEGELDAAGRRAAEAHLDACPSCLEVLAALGRVRSSSEAATGPAETAVSEGAARYELGDEIARGGMGRILEAWDRVLARRVAIKTIRSADHSRLEARFRREMALTARLQHPAIVPIHDAGVLEDGTAFYAMTLVEGRSLAVCLAAAADARERLALVPAIEQLVDAVAYAHAQGVIHRDLKPANVLVGRFGETVLLDWGLAKELAADDAPASPTESEPDAEEADDGQTRAGQVLGTPGYLAPEVARGQPATERSDVYSLGVILAEVLSGHRPDPRDNAPPSLDDLPALVPMDLVAIVRRALATDPARRYAEAGELSADLRRFSAGQLVAARQYSALDRLLRFARRHRAAVGVGAVALAVIAVGSVVAIRGLVSARDRAERARAVADAERQTALADRQAAERLIDFTLDDLRSRLEQLGKLELLAGVAKEVEAYYAHATVRDGAEGIPDLLRLGRALATAGRVRMDAGDLEGARRAFADSRDAFAQARDRGAGPQAGQRLSRSWMSLSIIALRQGRTDLAIEQATQARTIAEAGVAGDPASPKWHDALAFSLTALGRAEMTAGDLDAAVRAFEAAAESVPAIARDPDVSRRADLIAHEVESQLGAIAEGRGDSAAALEHFGRVVEIARRQHAARPDDPIVRYDVAAALTQLANARLEANASDPEVDALLDEALELHRGLRRLDATNVGWAAGESRVRGILADRDARVGNLAEAQAHYEVALEIDRRLSEADPSNAMMRFNLAAVQTNLASVQRSRGDLSAAAEHVTAATEIFAALLAETPDAPAFAAAQAEALAQRGLVEVALGNVEAARDSLRRAEALAPDADNTSALADALGVAGRDETDGEP